MASSTTTGCRTYSFGRATPKALKSILGRDLFHDPADRARTTRRYAGESMKNGANTPGLVAIAAAVVASAVGLVGYATGHLNVGVIATVLVVALTGAGVVWIQSAHRRVRAPDHNL
jgi:hypothetical protein